MTFLSLSDDDGVVRWTPLSHERRARPPAPSLRSLAALRSPCATCPRSEAPPSPRPTTEVQTHDAVALCHHHSRPPSAALSCTPRLASAPWPPYALAFRSRSCAPPPVRALVHLPPLTAPQPHTATLIISPLLTPSISSGGVRHAGTWRPLPPARAPPRSGASQGAPARGRSSCARGPLAAG